MKTLLLIVLALFVSTEAFSQGMGGGRGGRQGGMGGRGGGRRGGMYGQDNQTYGQGSAGRQQPRGMDRDYLQQRLSASGLSQEQENQLIDEFMRTYQPPASQRRFGEEVAFLEDLANDPDLTQEQRLQSIRERYQGQPAR